MTKVKQNMFIGASNLVFENAKTLRSNLTHAELLLWSYLKQKPHGHKFRRQHPISIYIADFYCHSLKLVIEIDGSIHNIHEVLQHDIERQIDLEQHGLRFLRFTNEEVEKKLEYVIEIVDNFIINSKKPQAPNIF